MKLQNGSGKHPARGEKNTMKNTVKPVNATLNSYFAGKTVANDGKGLTKLIKKHFTVTDCQHTCSFVFFADIEGFGRMRIITEPVDLKETLLKVLRTAWV